MAEPSGPAIAMSGSRMCRDGKHRGQLPSITSPTGFLICFVVSADA
jgi:hypothetical protein